MIRIMHTADNHIGLTFNSYDDHIRDLLKAERFAALDRIVREANKRKAHFLVVAGDLFHKLNVSMKDISKTVGTLQEFDGEAVLVLPGNHDYYESKDSELWNRVKQDSKGTSIRILTDTKPIRYQDIDGNNVYFYPCPCPSKTSAEHRIGWVASEPKREDGIHIGIAHGNVEGKGLDENGRYFNMTERELADAGVHTWLLGHIHAPYPAKGAKGKQTFFMPGAHTPDSIKSKHLGTAWYIEIAPTGDMNYEQIESGKIRFARRQYDVRGETEIKAIVRDCGKDSQSGTVLEIIVTGQLSDADHKLLDNELKKLASQYLSFDVDNNVQLLLDAKQIGKLFPSKTLPNELLLELCNDSLYPGDAHVASEILKGLAQ